jgi:hypothetical protein
MVRFQFGQRKTKMGNEYGHGPRHYAIDHDRGVHIEDRAGVLVHRYLDEPFWRDAQGNVLPGQEPTPEPTPTPKQRKAK